MNPYNGYTGKEREAKLRAQHARVKRGFPAHPPGPCSICQDPTAPVEAHSEDYSLPYLWEPPAEYTVWFPVGTNANTYSENENSSATFELRVMVTSGGLVATSSPLFITVQIGGCGPAGC
ncbi:MAG TPA: hypothetical protein VN602_13610 [Gemmatimonadaceae bacterium]|nr:hypothetical protein [Gemmatimonadaceae bacterium]